MKKYFVLDTSVILFDPSCISKFDDNCVIIPITVLEEMDRFKKELTEIGRNARQFSRELDEFRKKGSLTQGVEVGRKGTLIIDLYTKDVEGFLPADLKNDKNDHRLLAIALKWKRNNPTSQTFFVTKDVNLRVKADTLGLLAVDFEPSQITIDELYTGNLVLDVPSTVIQSFRHDKRLPLPNAKYPHNMYIVLRDQGESGELTLGRFDKTKKEVVPLKYPKEGAWGILPKNIEQHFVMDALMDDKITLVTLVGKAGTGKTLLAIAAGLRKTVDESRYQKLLVSRPVFPLGKDIGYLPGEVEEKLSPWMQPIFDNIDFIVSFSSAGAHDRTKKRPSRSHWQELVHQGILQVEPLTYIRGRSLAFQFLIVDEAQNLTPHEIKTIITRAGEGTKVVLTGDCYQIDNPYIDSSNNGLTYVVERFKEEELSAHITLCRGERSHLAELATNLL